MLEHVLLASPASHWARVAVPGVRVVVIHSPETQSQDQTLPATTAQHWDVDGGWAAVAAVDGQWGCVLVRPDGVVAAQEQVDADSRTDANARAQAMLAEILG